MRFSLIVMALTFASCQQPSSRYIVTEGHATIQVPIESLTLAISIDTKDPSLDHANTITRGLVLKMFRTLKKFNLPDSNFVTLTDQSSNRSRSYDLKEVSEVSYSGELKGVDPRIYDQLFAKLLALGDISVKISSFQNVNLDQFNKQAYAQAVTNARKQAELLLYGTGAKLGRILKVLKVRDNPFDEYDDFEKHIDRTMQPKPITQYDMAAISLEPIFRRNTFEVSTSITIMFEIE